MRAIGMSPSPGTSRCDDATVPTLKSLTCTSRMRSTPSSDRRREAAFGPARVHLHAHTGVEPAREVDRRRAACARIPRRRATSSCARSRSRRRGRAPRRNTGAIASSNASAAASHVSGANGPGREHDRSGRRPRPRCRSIGRADRVGDPNGSDPRGGTDRARSGRRRAARVRPRRRRAAVPSSQPNASSFATDTPDVGDAVRGPEREVVGERQLEGADRADARAGMHAISRACGRGRCCCRRRAAG